MNAKKLTINSIRLSYLESKKYEDKGDFWVYYVVRRISFYPTWLFLKIGVTANQATLISIVVGVIGCSFLALGNYATRIVGALLINFWIVLDCVDGNIARFKGTLSNYGEFIDALGGYFLNGILFLSVGIGAFSHPEASFKFIAQIFGADFKRVLLVILGAWASLVITLSRLVYHKYINLFQTGDIKVALGLDAGKGLKNILYVLVNNLVSLSGFLTPILFLAVIFRWLSVFVLFYSLVNTVILATTVHGAVVRAVEL